MAPPAFRHAQDSLKSAKISAVNPDKSWSKTWRQLDEFDSILSALA